MVAVQEAQLIMQYTVLIDILEFESYSAPSKIPYCYLWA